jgi:hypothetical protein
MRVESTQARSSVTGHGFERQPASGLRCPSRPRCYPSRVRRPRRRPIILLGAGLIAAACGGTTISNRSTSADAGEAVDASDGGAAGCVPGRSIACVGPGGCPSNQVCNGSGTAYGPCSCTSDSGSGPGSGSDAASNSDANHSFYPPLDATTTAPPDDDADALPAVGSPACQDHGCVFCADGYYHCQPGLVFPPCQAGLSPTASCTESEVPSEGCFWCPGTGQPAGEGWLWECTGSSWSLTIFGCTP